MNFWKKYKPYIIQVVLALAAGGVGSLLSGGQALYKQLDKPPLAPPGWVFPVVWSILYVLMGIAAGIVVQVRGREAKAAVRRYYIQLAINVLWPVLFFRFELLTVALIWLALLVGAVALARQSFRRIDSTAGWLLVPYLAWCLFALYLNAGFVILN